MPDPGSANKTKVNRVLQLEGLRGLLALYVAVHHLWNFCGLPYNTPVKALLVHADKAVDCFMILSGFVIFLMLDTLKLSYWSFLIRRFFRIWPALALAFFLSLATVPAEKGIWSGGLHATGLCSPGTRIATLERFEKSPFSYSAALLTLTHGLIPSKLLPGVEGAVLVPAWSIGLEWQFYLVAPLVFALCVRGRIPRLLSAVMLLAIMLIGPQWMRWNGAFLPGYANYFALGALSYFAYIHVKPAGRIAVSAFALCLAAVFFADDAAVSVWALAMLAILPAGHSLDYVAQPVSRFLCWRPIDGLGKISYSVYLLHWPVFVMVIAGAQRLEGIANHPTATFLVAFAIGFPLLILCSSITYVFVEKPFIKLGRKLGEAFSGVSQRTPAAILEQARLP